MARKILICAFIILFESVALAEPAKLETMTPLDLARLDAAMAHIDAIMIEARAKSASYRATVEQICSRYKISPNDLGTHVLVNPETGIIARTPTPPSPPQPVPATKK